MGRGLLDGDDRGVRACRRRARPDAGDLAEGGLGGLARRAAGCGRVVVPAVSTGNAGGVDDGGLGATGVTELPRKIPIIADGLVCTAASGLKQPAVISGSQNVVRSQNSCQ